MRKLLLIVDVQEGFINEKSAWLPEKIGKYIAKSDYTDVVATQFVNHHKTPCYKFMDWTGCMTPDEKAICPEVLRYCKKVFQKDTYTSVTPQLLDYIAINHYAEIHICGISSGCCVVATAYDLFDRGFNIKVIPALCAVTGRMAGYKEATDFMLTENVPCLEV